MHSSLPFDVLSSCIEGSKDGLCDNCLIRQLLASRSCALKNYQETEVFLKRLIKLIYTDVTVTLYGS